MISLRDNKVLSDRWEPDIIQISEFSYYVFFSPNRFTNTRATSTSWWSPCAIIKSWLIDEIKENLIMYKHLNSLYCVFFFPNRFTNTRATSISWWSPCAITKSVWSMRSRRTWRNCRRYRANWRRNNARSFRNVPSYCRVKHQKSMLSRGWVGGIMCHKYSQGISTICDAIKQNESELEKMKNLVFNCCMHHFKSYILLKTPINIELTVPKLQPF